VLAVASLSLHGQPKKGTIPILPINDVMRSVLGASWERPGRASWEPCSLTLVFINKQVVKRGGGMGPWITIISPLCSLTNKWSGGRRDGGPWITIILYTPRVESHPASQPASQRPANKQPASQLCLLLIFMFFCFCFSMQWSEASGSHVCLGGHQVSINTLNPLGALMHMHTLTQGVATQPGRYLQHVALFHSYS